MFYVEFFQAWVGHPYFDVVDNSSDFEDKIMRMINVCRILFSMRLFYQKRKKCFKVRMG